MMKDELRFNIKPGALGLSVAVPAFPSAAVLEAVAALGEDMQHAHDLMSAALMRDLAPVLRMGDIARAALATVAQSCAATVYARAVAGQAIAASAFRLTPEPSRIVLHVHTVRVVVEDRPGVSVAEDEPAEWQM
jgi:hypothetical protein